MVFARVADYLAGSNVDQEKVDHGRRAVAQGESSREERVMEADEQDLEAARPPYQHVSTQHAVRRAIALNDLVAGHPVRGFRGYHGGYAHAFA